MKFRLLSQIHSTCLASVAAIATSARTAKTKLKKRTSQQWTYGARGWLHTSRLQRAMVVSQQCHIRHNTNKSPICSSGLLFRQRHARVRDRRGSRRSNRGRGGYCNILLRRRARGPGSTQGSRGRALYRNVLRLFRESLAEQNCPHGAEYCTFGLCWALGWMQRDSLLSPGFCLK